MTVKKAVGCISMPTAQVHGEETLDILAQRSRACSCEIAVSASILRRLAPESRGRALYDRPLQSCGNGCDGRPIPAPSEVLLPAVAVRAVRFWSLNRDGPAPISNGQTRIVLYAPITRLTASLLDRLDIGATHYEMALLVSRVSTVRS